MQFDMTPLFVRELYIKDCIEKLVLVRNKVGEYLEEDVKAEPVNIDAQDEKLLKTIEDLQAENTSLKEECDTKTKSLSERDVIIDDLKKERDALKQELHNASVLHEQGLQDQKKTLEDLHASEVAKLVKENKYAPVSQSIFVDMSMKIQNLESANKEYESRCKDLVTEVNNLETMAESVKEELHASEKKRAEDRQKAVSVLIKTRDKIKTEFEGKLRKSTEGFKKSIDETRQRHQQELFDLEKENESMKEKLELLEKPDHHIRDLRKDLDGRMTIKPPPTSSKYLRIVFPQFTVIFIRSCVQ